MRGVSPLLFWRHSSKRPTRSVSRAFIPTLLDLLRGGRPFHQLHGSPQGLIPLSSPYNPWLWRFCAVAHPLGWPPCGGTPARQEGGLSSAAPRLRDHRQPPSLSHRSHCEHSLLGSHREHPPHGRP